MQFYGMSNKGKVRGNNEDFYHVSDSDIKLFVVADGMGGVNAGEVASALAVSSIVDYINSHYDVADRALLLRQAISSANSVVYNTSRSSSKYESMGTTVVCALIDGDMLNVANVGDSRCYLFSKNELNQISTDHSYVQELIDSGMLTKEQARVHPNRNLITRAIGIERFVKIDTFCIDWKPNDKLLLASDGLTGMISEEKMKDILNSDGDCKSIVEQLIDAANNAGGCDNITAVLVQNV